MKKLLIILTIFLYGSCVPHTAYISSNVDPRYAPVRTDPIKIFLSDEARVPDRQFYFFLKEEMIANGFNIVEDGSKAKYLLSFQIGSKTSNIQSALVVPSTSTTVGQIGNTPYSETTQSSQAIPYSYNYTTKHLWLDLYAFRDIAKGKVMTIWEGYIGVGEKVYESYPREILKTLFDVFGSNYEDHTPIKTDQGSEK